MRGDGGQEVERCLEAVVLKILEVDPGDAASDRGKEAFKRLQDLQRAVTRVSAAAGQVLGAAPEKVRILAFLAEYGSVRRGMYRSQVASILQALLGVAEWEEASRSDSALVARLCLLDERIKGLLDPPAPVEAVPVLPEADSAASARDDVAVAEPVVTVDEGGYPVTQAAAQAAPAEDMLPELHGFLASPSLPQPPEAPSTSAAPPTVSASASNAAVTRHLMRSSFEDLAILDYEVTKLNVDKVLDAFSKLSRALCRAHWEHSQRLQSGVEGDASGSSRHGLSDATDFSGGSDFMVAALDGISWEPGRVFMLLFNLQREKAIHKRRIVSAAQMLTQISPLFCDAARSNEFLTRWLGACRGPDDPAHVVSYGFAKTLQWLAWDAAWHWVNKQRRCEKDSEKHMKLFERHEKDLLASVELPKSILEVLVKAAKAAAQHCALMRYPEEPKGWGQLLGVLVKGPGEDRGPFKDLFHSCFDDVKSNGAIAPVLLDDLRWLIWNIAWYPGNKSKGWHKDAQTSLVRAYRHLQRAYRRDTQWRGVNLGGWFLLEPGPCDNFWESLPDEARATNCEWDCCQALGPREASRRLAEHRRTYFGLEDFARMREAGLTHVRLPIGYWCVAGARQNEPYVGPCLEALDAALDRLEKAGLRVLLDLHGSVGGENSEAPCGRTNLDWQPSDWDWRASLQVLRILAERYAGRVCVCAVGVSNEPAESLRGALLAEYYEEAVRTIRQAGMRAGEVAVVLPIFTERRVAEVLDFWERRHASYEDCVFDVHFYQCFGGHGMIPWTWQSLSADGHLREARKRAEVLRGLSACCVSEWSLAVPDEATKHMSEVERDELLRNFAKAQLEAYETATHGWFFWTWKDSAGIAWNLERCLAKGLLQTPEGGRTTSLLQP